MPGVKGMVRRDLNHIEDSERRRLDTKLWHKYGITADDYDLLFIQQGGKCAACGVPPTGENLVVDHNHTTGQVRGLLHRGCNAAIGHFRDDPELLLKAAAYLKGE